MSLLIAGNSPATCRYENAASSAEMKPIETKVHDLHSIISKLQEQQSQALNSKEVKILQKCESELLKSFGNSLLKRLPDNKPTPFQKLHKECELALCNSTNFNSLQSNLLRIRMRYIKFFKYFNASHPNLKSTIFNAFASLVSLHQIDVTSNATDDKLLQFCEELSILGSCAKAIEFIKEITNEDLKDDATLIICIFMSKWDNEHAIQSIQLAESIINHEKKDTAFLFILFELALQEKYEIAIMLSTRIEDPYERHNAISDICIAYVHNNKLEEARKHLETMTDLAKREWALCDIATLLALEDKNEEALTVLNLIQNILVKDQTISNISIIRAESGELLESVKLAITMTNPSKRKDTFCRIGVELTLRHSDASLASISRIFAQNGYLKEAIKLTDRIQDPFIKDSVTCDLAIALAKDGVYENATLLASSIQDGMLKDTAFSGIAITLAEKGEIIKAIELTKMITEEILQGAAFRKISSKLRVQGYYRRSIQLCNKITYKMHQHMALFEIFEDREVLKYRYKYIRLASEIANIDIRNQIFKKITPQRTGITKAYDNYLNHQNFEAKFELLLKENNFNGAIMLVDSHPYSRDKNYGKIATAFAREKKIEEAIALADKIQNEASKEQIFTLISTYLNLMEKVRSVV